MIYIWTGALLIHVFLTILFYYKTKGTSLTFSIALAMILQVLIPSIFVANLDELNFIPLDPEVITNMWNSYLIYFGISLIGFLLVYLNPTNFFKTNIVVTEKPGYRVKKSYQIFFAILAILQFVFLIVDGKIQFLLTHTFTAGEGYSNLRLSIIEEGVKNYASSILNYVKYITSTGTSFGYILFLFTANVNKPFFKKKIGLISFMGLVVMIMSLSNYEKGPVLLFISITLLVRYANAIRQFGYLKLLTIVVILNFFVILTVSFTTGINNFGKAFSMTYYRIFVEPTVCSYMHFSVFPKSESWVRFSNFNFIKILFNLPKVLQNRAISIDVAENFTGLYYSANANLIPTGWAQLGFIGVVVYCSVGFVLFAITDIFVFKKIRNGSIKMLKYFYLFWFLYFANTSIENFIFSSGCVFWPIILYFSTVSVPKKSDSLKLELQKG